MAEQIRSADYLVKTILETPGVLEKLQEHPEDTLKQLAVQAIQQNPRALEQDKYVYRIVVFALGLAVNVVIIGAIALAIMTGKEVSIPDVLTALGATAIGALAGILAPSPAAQKA